MRRISPECEINYISNVIDKNIEAHKILNDRGLLSQNILSQLRNLLEDVAILINNYDNNLDLDSHYDNVDSSIKYVSSKQKYKFIYKFHHFLQSTASHYTPSDNNAERLIHYYFRYICMLKKLLKDDFSIVILNNIDNFPIYEDSLTKDTYISIASKIEEIKLNSNKSLKKGRFYVQKAKPIYANGNLYYEITLTKATDYVNKFEHITMYSKIYIPDNYSIKLSYFEKNVDILSSNVKIKIIDNYFPSIRPGEFKNLFKIFGMTISINDSLKEYINLMKVIKENEITLLDIVLENNEKFCLLINEIKKGADNNNLSELLAKLRKVILLDNPGSNLVRYLINKLENVVLKDQLNTVSNRKLSNLYFKNQSIPFDSMPYGMSLSCHNTSWKHLIESIDMSDREYELIYNHVRYNCDNNNILYTPIEELKRFGDVEKLVSKYNKILLEKIGNDRSKLIIENTFVYINSYEKDSINIINNIEEYEKEKNDLIISSFNEMDKKIVGLELSEEKIEILKNCFVEKSALIVHGPAGTGKTKMLEAIACILPNFKKIFLANTNTAVDNLERRIKPLEGDNSAFKTVCSFKYDTEEYDILIIDECSTISNSEMLTVLNKQRYKAIVLSGDMYQIESIKYGNWFSLAYKYFKDSFAFDLKDNNRTSDNNLIEFWDMVRNDSDDVVSKINSQEYSSEIDVTLLNKKNNDEIVLCLNYDGVYGINNINKILQEKNTGIEYNIGVDTYKIGDPIVFNDCPRFNNVLYNNMKGIIKNVEIDDRNDVVWFSIEMLENINYFGASFRNIEIVSFTDNKMPIIKFFVKNFDDSSSDSDRYEHIIPFNLAYAISIHKAQGLEYESVKVIITSNVEDIISKNIFYTAITRTKSKLKIYWSTETQTKLLNNFKQRPNSRDMSILKSKLYIN